jgi:hypothetical protein
MSVYWPQTPTTILGIPNNAMKRFPRRRPRSKEHGSARYLREAPKFVRFLTVCESFSLSSLSLLFLNLLAALPAVADVGVACADPVSLNEVDSGVGACDAGVEPPEAFS